MSEMERDGKNMNDYTFSVHFCDSQQEMEATQPGIMAMIEGLGSNISKQLGDIELGRSVRIFVRDKENCVVGGIAGDIFGGWLYIPLLWVEESMRDKGYGTKPIELLEQEAKRLGCKHAHVDTYSFEARPFYERLGYELFATLEDYPEGHRKYFLKKAL
jgi:GNAT superfamily N-acetyltransferase